VSIDRIPAPGGGSGSALTDVTATHPVVASSPSAGVINLALDYSPEPGPAYIPAGLMKSIGRARVQWNAFQNTATSQVYGIPATVNASGTYANGTLSLTNYFTSGMRGTRVSSAALNNAASIWGASGSEAMRGAALNAGGFVHELIFGWEALNSDSRLGAFLKTTTGAIGGSIEPSSLTNVIGIGCDSTDTNLQIMHNDSIASCIKIDTGWARPTVSVDVYYMAVWCTPSAASVSYFVQRLDSPATYLSGTINNNLPITTSGTATDYQLAWNVHASTGPTSTTPVTVAWFRSALTTFL
jgi:hypothetical protein